MDVESSDTIVGVKQIIQDREGESPGTDYDVVRIMSVQHPMSYVLAISFGWSVLAGR